MALYSSSFSWGRDSIEFAAVDGDVHSGTAEIVERQNAWILKSPGSFPFSNRGPQRRALSIEINGDQAILIGNIYIIDGDAGLCVDEIRIGTTEVEQDFVSVMATFEWLRPLCENRRTDGPARKLSDSLRLPRLDSAPEMTAYLHPDKEQVRIESSVPTKLEDFDKHVSAFQDLITFASDRPRSRVKYEATDQRGNTVVIIGRDKYSPFGNYRRQSAECSLRLGSTHLQAIVDRWWEARETLRPVTQIAVALKYQPGFVESDIILTAASIEHFANAVGTKTRPVLDKPARKPITDALKQLKADLQQRGGEPLTTQRQIEVIDGFMTHMGHKGLREKTKSLVASLPGRTIEKSRIDVDAWETYFMDTRNGIAHGGNKLEGKRDLWLETNLMRVVRDANYVILTLLLLNHLGIPVESIELAASRLGIRYGKRDSEAEIFRASS